MNQRQVLLERITDFCNKQGSRTFSLKELNNDSDYRQIGIGGDTPNATVRRLLQELRDENLIMFNQKRGSYTLLGQTILKNETIDDSIVKIKASSLDKQEYLIETYARNKGWVKMAKEKLGVFCLYPKCSNTFNKDNNEPYIEVHHILPLHQDGEDGIWNLSVVCAHHHRMAHFADAKTRIKIEKQLEYETAIRI